MKRLVIIDGKSVFYRGYYAMGALSLPDGTPTGGIYGFAAIAMEIVKRLNPYQVVVAWDSKTSTAKRKAIFADYKAGRVKPGADFYAQIPLLKELIENLGWAFVEVDEYEADDIIGTLSRQADETLDVTGKCEYETFIVSSDLDMLQIVDDNTRMYRLLKGFSEIQEIDVAEVEAKYGIEKSQFLDLKALKGDNSDNIPGVPGIGEKGAVKLLNDFGTLDGIYEHIDEIKGATHDKLVAGKESAYMSLKLAKIMFDAPVELSKIPAFELNAEKVINGLKKLRFNSLIRKFELNKKVIQEKQGSEDKTAAETGESQNNDSMIEGADGPEMKLLFDMTPDEMKAKMYEDEDFAKKILSGELFSSLKPGNVLNDLDYPLVPVLYKMEKKGMMIDRVYFDNLKSEYAAEVSRKEREIQLMAGVDFNVNSPVQLSEVLFDKLGLPTKGIKKTSRGYSTGVKELEKLKNEHAIIPRIMEYREAAKLLSTYILPMPELADENSRIHTTFTQGVTATGRLSSVNPNLQNIPVRTEEGKRIREGFVAPEGKVLVSADYSQFELRLAAVLSGDKALTADFNSGIDIHTKTAAEAFYRDEIAKGMSLEEAMSKVTKQQRRAAKVINFGVLYGMSAKGLADAAEMSIYDAKQFIEHYFELRAPIRKKLDEILKQAREKGYVETFFGRRRLTPDVKAPNFLVRAAAERAAANMPIQGTEADLMKRAMILVDQKLPEGAELIMQVHDSLIVECDEALEEQVSKILKETMEGVAPELDIKLAVEVTSGRNWGEL
jgi:DNA polymerase I-like protein with 3'-5' exonuclease and polymerase domains